MLAIVAPFDQGITKFVHDARDRLVSIKAMAIVYIGILGECPLTYVGKLKSICDGAFEVVKDSLGNSMVRNLWVLVVATYSPDNIS